MFLGKKSRSLRNIMVKSSKRKGAKDKIQGKGWEMYESSRTQEEILIFS